ncbi:transposon Tf2-6 polyprotein [Trichonephila clavipes]|nr:transposon Tf2-6 polyprotein [Trichonephila clavipes]
MAFLLSKKKEDLIELAEELGLIVEAGLTKPKLKDLIVKSPDYVEEGVKAEKNVNTMNNSENAQAPKLIHETFHKFNMKDDISLNLTLVERHAELTFLPKKDWQRELIIADQIKKNAPYEFQEHFLDEWSTISSPAEIAEKFEEYESVRRTLRPKFYNSFAKGRYEASGSSDTYFLKELNISKVEDQVFMPWIVRSSPNVPKLITLQTPQSKSAHEPLEKELRSEK